METPTMSAAVDGVALDRIAEVVRRVTGRDDAQVATVDARPAARRVENMTTAALTHVSGTLTDGTPWRVFVKTLRPAWKAPQWNQIPPAFHAQVCRVLDWQDEPRVYTGPLSGDLPGGMRLPELYAIDEDDERITLWLEEVDDTTPWDVTRYRRTAWHLGRLAGRWSERRAVDQLGARRRPMAELFHGKISHSDIPALTDDALWQTPALRAATARHGDLHGDLDRLAAVAPALVEVYEELPHALSHGDATPDNLREPESGDIVAIDLSYVSTAALGSDLGQLLVGRFESGVATEDDLDAIQGVLLPAYVDGLRAEGLDVDPQLVEAGWAITLAVRSVFSALIIDHGLDFDQSGPDELLARRALACRFGIDLALGVADRTV
jgi:hypothetical protein